ncbi:MAG: glycosyltransferase [Acidobacteriota bacterium]|nr:glycosyltransferase [Acidobacteriota bacterium]MDQ7087130.1 glycosyltransferase [Acidobacteriota bacterium]
MSDAPATLHLDTGRELRGGQRQVAFVVEGSMRRGIRTGLVTPPDAPLARRLGSLEGLARSELPFRGEWSLAALLGLRRLLREGGWQVVACHTPHAISYAAFACGRRAALVAHRRVDFPLGRNPLARRKRGWPHLWVAVAGSVARQLERDGVPPEKIQVVPSAIDPARLEPRRSRQAVRRELGVADGVTLIVSVGALAAHKGHASLIEAAARLQGPFCLVIAGEGELRRELEDRVRGKGLSGQVRFVGQRSDVADLLAACDLYVFPSLSGEGSPAGLKEPLAMGVPTLASDLPAHREVGIDADWTFPPGDVDALAGLLRRALEGRGPVVTAGLAAGVRERFSPERLVDDTLAAYRTALELRGAGRAGRKAGG